MQPVSVPYTNLSLQQRGEKCFRDQAAILNNLAITRNKVDSDTAAIIALREKVLAESQKAREEAEIQIERNKQKNEATLKRIEQSAKETPFNLVEVSEPFKELKTQMEGEVANRISEIDSLKSQIANLS